MIRAIFIALAQNKPVTKESLDARLAGAESTELMLAIARDTAQIKGDSRVNLLAQIGLRLLSEGLSHAYHEVETGSLEDADVLINTTLDDVDAIFAAICALSPAIALVLTMAVEPPRQAA